MMVDGPRSPCGAAVRNSDGYGLFDERWNTTRQAVSRTWAAIFIKVSVRHVASRRLQRRIISQRVVIAQIVMAGRNRQQPLSQHLPLLVHDVSRIEQTGTDRVVQTRAVDQPPAAATGRHQASVARHQNQQRVPVAAAMNT